MILTVFFWTFHVILHRFLKKIMKSTFKLKAEDIDLGRRTDVYDWIIIGTTSQDACVQGWDNHSNKTGCQSFFLSNHAIIHLLSFCFLGFFKSCLGLRFDNNFAVQYFILPRRETSVKIQILKNEKGVW